MVYPEEYVTSIYIFFKISKEEIYLNVLLNRVEFGRI